MKVLDLFSGIGGFSLGLERAGMETVAFCEIEDYPRQILAKHWPDVPCYEDVKKLTKERLDADGIGPIDVICGGYPCQPFSNAGKRQGQDDDRHLWPEVLRLLQEIRPRWFIGENVAGHISMGLDQVLSDLESEGYTWQPFVVPACAVDADHRRDRIWIVAHAECDGLIASEKRGSPEKAIRNEQGGQDDSLNIEGASCLSATKQDVANTSGRRCGGESQREIQQQRGTETFSPSETLTNTRCSLPQDGAQGQRNRWRGANEQQPSGTRRKWPTEPTVGRVANGVPRRVDRLKALGNAVVPQIPEMIGRAIMEIDS